ncbi:hypothetical protein HPB51_014326 [Rhipicephalus microplus]|uniref:Uncharacterized protein n=1 Tax=Rhipicephalus microplus TaxID=6941 RepID=A0A9J6E293_RHIMP|nr:hypothetical protein HPB51_014326 [Rhipicephalus microplus]
MAHRNDSLSHEFPQPKPYLDKDLTSPVTGTMIAATDHDDEVPATYMISATSTARDTSAPPDFLMATWPQTLEPGPKIFSPIIRQPIPELPQSTRFNKHDLPSTLAICASCRQPLPSTLTSPAAEVPTRDMLRRNFRDAATLNKDQMTDSPTAEQLAHSILTTQADNHKAALTSTGTPADLPAEPTPNGSHDHPPAPFKSDMTSQQCTLNADVPLGMAQASSTFPWCIGRPVAMDLLACRNLRALLRARRFHARRLGQLRRHVSHTATLRRHSRDSIPRLTGQQPRILATRAPWQGVELFLAMSDTADDVRKWCDIALVMTLIGWRRPARLARHGV